MAVTLFCITSNIHHFLLEQRHQNSPNYLRGITNKYTTRGKNHFLELSRAIPSPLRIWGQNWSCSPSSEWEITVLPFCSPSQFFHAAQVRLTSSLLCGQFSTHMWLLSWSNVAIFLPCTGEPSRWLRKESKPTGAAYAHCRTAVSHWRGRFHFFCFTSYLVKHKDLLCGPCTPTNPGCSGQQPQLCLPLCQYLYHAEVLSAAIWYLLPYQMQTLNNVWPMADLGRTILGSPPSIAILSSAI